MTLSRKFALLLLMLSGTAGAQEKIEEQIIPRTRIGISAGSAFSKFEKYTALPPTLSFHAGMFVTHRFKHLEVQAGAEYLPVGSKFSSWWDGGYAEFKNHLLNIPVLFRFHNYRKNLSRLTFDLGLSYGWTLFYSTDWIDPPGWICFGPGTPFPVPLTQQFAVMAGTSWQFSRHNAMGLVAHLSGPSQDQSPSAKYVMLKASISHAF